MNLKMFGFGQKEAGYREASGTSPDEPPTIVAKKKATPTISFSGLHLRIGEVLSADAVVWSKQHSVDYHTKELARAKGELASAQKTRDDLAAEANRVIALYVLENDL